MRHLFTAISLILGIAACILLGLATFCVPVNDNLWLLRAKAAGIDMKFGALGYSLNGADSPTRVGYEMPRILGKFSKSTSDFLHTLTYVLVLFPISFALACLATIVMFLALFHERSMGSLGACIAELGAACATVAFAILIVIYIEINDELHLDDVLDMSFGQSFILTVIAAGFLYCCGMLLLVIACCACFLPRNSRRSKSTKASYGPAASTPVSVPAPPAPAPGQPAHREIDMSHADSYESAQDLPSFPEHDPSMNEALLQNAPQSEEVTIWRPNYDSHTWGAWDATLPPSTSRHTLHLEPASASRTHLLEDSTHADHYTAWTHAPTEAYTAPECPDTYADASEYTPGLTRDQADAWFIPRGPNP